MKKIYPKRTLIIGIIKYPKLASITRFVEIANIHTAQFVKIKIPDIKSINIFFLSLINSKKIFHFEKINVVIKSVAVVQILRCITTSI